MGFAFCPDIGPPRVIRFDELTHPGLLSWLDVTHNVLSVDRARYELLSKFDQQRLLKTQEPYTFLEIDRNGVLSITTGEEVESSLPSAA